MSSPSGSQYSASQDSQSPPPHRANRWPGAPSTWLSLTSQERGLAASLDTLRDRDLSIHLYNAHALKKRAVNGVKPEDDDFSQPFVPPRSWTAWPLPPDRVPRDGEIIGEEDGEEEFTLKMRGRERASGALEDILVGLSLKSAKERFEGREWAEKEKGIESEGDGEGDGLVAAPVSELKDGKGQEAPKEKVYLQPVVSADDERSREILRPTIRHTLSRLDDILMALHHARKTCRRYSSVSAPNSDEEFHSAEEEIEDEDENEVTPIRPVGRPKKFENLTHRGKPDENDEEDRTFMGTEHLRPKKPGRGRKPKQYPRLEGEDDRAYLVRVARLQKKPIPLFTGQTAASPSPVRKSPQKAPTPSPSRKPSSTHNKGKTPGKATKRRQKEPGLRDWSEVLGSAALVGFPPDVIARATQRCANIFGESMNMRTMLEAPFDAENADTLTTYQPEEILDFDSENDESSDGDSDAFTPKHKDGYRKEGHSPKIETCFCPVPNCLRQSGGFSSTQKMKEHLKNGHKMTKEQIKEFEVPSDEEMDGAVHVDGFLRAEKRAFRGPDRGKRKQSKRAKRAEISESEQDQDEEEDQVSEERGWTTSEEEKGADEQVEDEIKVEKRESSWSEDS